jgi:hypothetical protein
MLWQATTKVGKSKRAPETGGVEMAVDDPEELANMDQDALGQRMAAVGVPWLLPLSPSFNPWWCSWLCPHRTVLLSPHPMHGVLCTRQLCDAANAVAVFDCSQNKHYL